MENSSAGTTTESTLNGAFCVLSHSKQYFTKPFVLKI